LTPELAANGSSFRGLGRRRTIQWAERRKNEYPDQSIQPAAYPECECHVLIYQRILILARKQREFLEANTNIMNVLAVVMFGYAALIAFNTQRAAISRGFTLFTVIGDSAWVLGSVLLLVLPFFNFTTDAKWAIGITAICVDIFATLQFLEWRKM
jgi:hypothetical protein